MTGGKYFLIYFCTFLVVQCTKVKIGTNGGYSGIVIKIEDSVDEDKCPEILQNMKKLLDESSFSLYDALNRKAYFKSVSLVVPSHWRDSKCQTVITNIKSTHPYRVADILVAESSSPVHGARPITSQSKGCGNPGDIITIPHEFLTRWNETWQNWGDPARLFAHEWAKYRYGIFDEVGYPGDKLYPDHFLSNGKILPTGTSNVPVEGAWLDAEGNPGCNPTLSSTCSFMPYAQNDQVFCSLGFLYNLPSVNTYCDKKTSPKIMAPTKHNVLCSGKSAMEVIMKHEDFNSQYQVINKKVTKVNIKPTISIIRNPKPKYVLIMETSTELDSHGQWKWVNKAAQKLIRYDLPLDSNVGIVTFSNTSKIQHSMVQITGDSVRSRLADTIPDKYHLLRSSSVNLLLGVQDAIHEVLRKDVAGAHLILVTRGTEESLSISDEQTIEEYVKYYHIKVSTILIPQEENKIPLAFYDSVAQLSGGSSHIIRSSRNRNLKTYLDLIQSFTTIMEGDHIKSMPQLVHQKIIEMTGYSSSSGTFTINQNLGRDTKFGIFVEDEEDHLIKSISFTDRRGQLYGPFTSMSSLYDIINLKAINYPVNGAPPFDQDDLIGLPWQYVIEWYPGGSQRQKSAIVVTSRPRDMDFNFEIDLWTNSAGSSDIVTSQSPLALFARVTRGQSPILEARVDVGVTVSSTNATTESYSIRLVDDGNGDPDLQQGDGIYSRYLTHYPSQGRYSFTVTVTDNNRRAYFIISDRNLDGRAKRAMPLIQASNGKEFLPVANQKRCCGSKITVSESQRQTTGEFIRTKKGPVIHLLTVPGLGVDLMPPSRIIDLEIKQLEKKRHMLLATWTAPGDDFDSGIVTGYKFVYAANTSGLLDAQVKDYKILTKFERPDKAGTQTSFQMSFEEYNKEFYIGLLAFDERLNEGKVSNLVRVYINSNDVPTTSSQVPEQTPVSASQDNQDDGVMIGILCGTFLVIGLMLWLGIWFMRNHKSTKNGGVNATLVTGIHGDHDTSSSDLEIKTPPRRHAMVPQFSSLASGGPVGTFPRQSSSGKDSKDENTPTYWSASQLLGEHEQRNLNEKNSLYSTTTYHNNHPLPLDPIVEDPEETYGISEMYNLANRQHQITSTPIKYANLTFPRRGQSVSPSPVSESLIANTSRIPGPPREDLIYGYAQSEPPNGIYGTLQRKNSKGKIPPQIPPKPSLNALLGLTRDGDTHSLVDDVLLSSGQQNINEANTKEETKGLTVRNISHV